MSTQHHNFICKTPRSTCGEIIWSSTLIILILCILKQGWAESWELSFFLFQTVKLLTHTHSFMVYFLRGLCLELQVRHSCSSNGIASLLRDSLGNCFCLSAIHLHFQTPSPKMGTKKNARSWAVALGPRDADVCPWKLLSTSGKCKVVWVGLGSKCLREASQVSLFHPASYAVPEFLLASCLHFGLNTKHTLAPAVCTDFSKEKMRHACWRESGVHSRQVPGR